MITDLLFQIKSLSRAIYYVTDEEDRLLLELSKELGEGSERAWVFNSAMGLRKIKEYIEDWTTRAHAVNDKQRDIHEALIQVYRDDPKKHVNFYIFTDAEHYLRETMVQRRILNILHQSNELKYVKILIFIGTRKFLPINLARYFQVVQDKGLAAEEITSLVGDISTHLQMPPPVESDKIFKGFTSFEIKSAISQSIIKTKGRGREGARIDPALITDFKRQQLTKTELVQYIDTSKFSFKDVGGIQRFKEWASRTKACWTPEGRAFGLRPPKGVLCVGLWGCGKSLATKAMGHAWQLPVVQLEMGRLRSNQVGESEANAYRALRIIESVAPCVVWADEAEKSLSGAHSSSHSDAGTTSRMIGILSTWLQETDAPVCFAMTANSLQTLPVEFVNRLDERFFFDLPSEEDRVDILKIHLRKMNQDPSRFELVELADKAKHMVGREIEQAIGAAMIESFHAGKPSLDQDILIEILMRKPRIVKTMVEEIRHVRDWVGWDAETNDGIRARFAAPPNKKEGIFNFVEEGGKEI
jgi:SpoVK/Ycf46/Vps4 family AAA+-type ATPase